MQRLVRCLCARRPVIRSTALVRDGQNENFRILDNIENCIRKSANQAPPYSRLNFGSKTWDFNDAAAKTTNFKHKVLSEARVLSIIERSSRPKFTLRIGDKPIARH